MRTCLRLPPALRQELAFRGCVNVSWTDPPHQSTPSRQTGPVSSGKHIAHPGTAAALGHPSPGPCWGPCFPEATFKPGVYLWTLQEISFHPSVWSFPTAQVQVWEIFCLGSRSLRKPLCLPVAPSGLTLCPAFLGSALGLTLGSSRGLACAATFFCSLWVFPQCLEASYRSVPSGLSYFRFPSNAWWILFVCKGLKCRWWALGWGPSAGGFRVGWASGWLCVWRGPSSGHLCWGPGRTPPSPRSLV